MSKYTVLHGGVRSILGVVTTTTDYCDRRTRHYGRAEGSGVPDERARSICVSCVVCGCGGLGSRKQNGSVRLCCSSQSSVVVGPHPLRACLPASGSQLNLPMQTLLQKKSLGLQALHYYGWLIDHRWQFYTFTTGGRTDGRTPMN